MRLVATGGSVFDGSKFLDADVAIEDGRIVEVANSIRPISGDTVLDCRDRVVARGFVDLHTHLRWPGDGELDQPEGISAQALAGGFCTVVAMANTFEPVDSPVRFVRAGERYRDLGVRVIVASTITKGREGSEPVDYAAMAEAGAMFFTDDGSGVQRSDLMLQALAASARYGFVVAQHAQCNDLFGEAVLNQSVVAERLGLPGAPEVAESAMVARDLELVKATAGILHVMHVSARETVGLVRQARREGMRVSMEVAPHHLLLTDEAAAGADTRYKVNPPLRSNATRMALVNALARGEFDAVATDHAPHPPFRKEQPWPQAAFGMVGIAEAFSVAWTALLGLPDGPVPTAFADGSKRLPLDRFRGELLGRLIWSLTAGPSAVLGETCTLELGDPGDLVILDPNAAASEVPTRLYRSQNSPYGGIDLSGSVVGVTRHGSVVVDRGLE